MKSYNTVKERMQRTEHALFGNGSIGIVEQIRDLSKEQKEFQTRLEARLRKIERNQAIGYGIILVVLFFGEYIIKKFF